MLNLKTMTLAALTAALISTSAMAGDYISLNAGEFNALRKDQSAFQYGGEYRFSDIGYGIHPILGGFGTDHSSAYGYGGFNWAVTLLPNQLYIVPNFAVGAYHKGDGKDLGGALEFRSGIEIDYQFPNAMQFGVALNHISNAGIYSRNPGEEAVMGTFSIPVGTVRSWIHL